MPTIGQLTATREGIKKDFEEVINQLFQGGVGRHPELVSGRIHVHEPFADDPDGRQQDKLDDKYEKVRTTVPAELDRLRDPFTRYIDTEMALDEANTQARADVRIGDQVLIANVPVTALMWWEKRFAELVSLAKALPVLDPKVRWNPSEREGVLYESDPVQTRSTKRTKVIKPVFQPTEFQAGQFTEHDSDVVSGIWTKIELSGALSSSDKVALVNRLRALQDAVKLARQEANRISVTRQHAGEVLADYIWDGQIPSAPHHKAE